jgi:4-aminobutyrate aminotransferase
MTLHERAQKVLPPVAGRYTKFGVVKGEGSYVYTEDGQKLLDFASGVAVCNVGHNNPAVVKAAVEQINQLIHGGHNVVYYEPYVALAEKLVALTGGDTMVYFSNSGAEANEGCFKLAKYVSKRPALISFKGSFHGRTFGTISITGSSAAYRKNYEGLMPSVYFAEYPYCYRCPWRENCGQCDMACLKQFDEIFKNLVDPEVVAAIIMEPVAGEGGYIVPPRAFITGLRQLCDQQGIYLILDEVQTGMGRTGTMFAFEQFDVRPDIFSSAKALGSGFPISAVIGKADIMKRWPSGAHGGTFGGNPVACAAALATIDLLEKGLLDNAAKMGDYLKGRLNGLKEKYSDAIGDVRGLGLMVAAEFADKDKTPKGELVHKVLDYCYAHGLILIPCGTYKHVIRFIAPTTVTKAELDEALAILDAGIRDGLSA